MSDYLLNEDGVGRILLEDGTGLLLLELSVAVGGPVGGYVEDVLRKTRYRGPASRPLHEVFEEHVQEAKARKRAPLNEEEEVLILLLAIAIMAFYDY